MSRAPSLFLFAALSVVGNLSAQPTAYTWTGSDGSPYDWDDDNNWTPDTGYPGLEVGDTATFPAVSASYTVSIDGRFSVDQLIFTSPNISGNYSLVAAAGADGFNLGGTSYTQNIWLQNTAGDQSTSGDLYLQADIGIELDAPSTLTLSGDITDNGSGYSVTITGVAGSTVVMTGSNDYSGTTTVLSDAILSAAAGTLASNSPVVLDDNATLSLSGSNSIASLNSTSSSTEVDILAGILTLNGSGSFAGVISGAGAVSVASGTLVLTNDNSYTGGTTIDNGAVLSLQGGGLLYDEGTVAIDNGTFDLSQSTASSVNIGNLSGTGEVNLGGTELVITLDGSSTYSGSITGAGGSLTLNGVMSTLTLSGSCGYTGTTTVASGELQAGSTSALAPLSDFTVDGVLDLQGNSNTINTLSGTTPGTVESTTGPATLTITNGGTFNGTLVDGVGPLGLTLTQGTFLLGATGNTYSGTTLIDDSAILQAGVANAFSSASAFMVNGTLDLANSPNTISSLSGTGSVTTGSVDGNLTVTGGGSFSGGISGLGGLIVTGGTLTLSSPVFANTYSGTTTISGGILSAGAIDAFSPYSPMIVNGTLSLGTFDNTIISLSGSGFVSLGTGTLTIDASPSSTIAAVIPTTFSGSITGSVGVIIAGGTNLTLTGTSNTYSGPTQIVDGILQLGNGPGTLSPNTDVTVDAAGELIDLPTFANSANSLTNMGTVSLAGEVTLATTYTQSASAALDLTFTSMGSSSYGEIATAGNITIAGSLTVTAGSGPYPSSGFFPLLSASAPGTLVGTFSPVTFVGFDSLNPLLAYSYQQVSLFFSMCTDSWTNGGTNNAWGNGANWGGGCVPGANGNQNDVAIFGSVGSSPITVSLANPEDSACESFTLYELMFTSMSGQTQYTIDQYSGCGSITFDTNPSGGTPQISLAGGSTPTMNVPLLINQNTELSLSDMSTMTFGPDTTLTSASTQTFMVYQGTGSGTGILSNEAILSPYGFIVASGTVINQNASAIVPSNTMTIGSSNSIPATVTNSGTAALMGTIGSGAVMTVGLSGTTTVVNDGIGAAFGVFGSGSTFTIQDPGTTTVTNTGVGVKMGAFGAGSNFTITGGTVTNSDGALLQAGPGGTFTISGGTVNNDLTSTVGTTAANLNLTGGILSTAGNVQAFNFTQSGGTLVLNLTSTAVFGNVAAVGLANIAGGTLDVEALAGFSATPSTVIDLITGNRGRVGQYANVTFSGSFGTNLIPHVMYTPTAVELVFGQGVTPTPTGSLGIASSVAVHQNMALMETNLIMMHERIVERKCKWGKGRGLNRKCPPKNEENVSSAGDLFADASGNVQIKENRLAQRVVSQNMEMKAVNASRFYAAPTANLGKMVKQGTVQPAMDCNSVGAMIGYDTVFKNAGVGLDTAYSQIKMDCKDGTGHIVIDTVRGDLYAIYVPPSLQEFAISGTTGFSYQWYDNHRNAGAPPFVSMIARGKPQGREADAYLGLEYIFARAKYSAIPESLTVTPFANAHFMWTQIDSYKESGAGSFDLHVSELNIPSLRSGLGLRLDLNYETQDMKFMFMPDFYAMWQHEFLDDVQSIKFETVSSSMLSTKANVLGAGRNTVWLGVDLLFKFYTVFELEGSYNYQWNSAYQNHGFYLGFGGNF